MNLGKHGRGTISCCCLAYRLLYPGGEQVPGAEALCAGDIVRIEGEPEVYHLRQ
jgi:hypothetical protein